MKPGQRSPRDLMACVGEPSRFHLVQLLGGGARCVTDLARAVGLSQSCTTRHLQVLQRSHVVSRTRAGKRVMYELIHDEPGLAPLFAWVHAESAAPEHYDALHMQHGVESRSLDSNGTEPPARTRPRSSRRPALRMKSITPASTQGPDPEVAPPARVRRTDSLEDYLL